MSEEKQAIKYGLAILKTDVSKMEESDFTRGLKTIQEHIRKRNEKCR